MTKPLVSIAPAFAWVPGFGPTLKNAPDLMEMAASGSEAIYLTILGTGSVIQKIQARDSDEEWITETIQELERAQPHLELAFAAAENASEARANLEDVEEMPKQIQEIIGQIDRALPRANMALRASQVIPALLGTAEDKTYLIITQNEDELRPTGGFISGAGLVTVRDGQILNLSFENAYLVDDWQNKPYELPPEPLQRFLGMDLFLFRDSNFWPDFATSAQKVMNLYTYGKGIQLDGVIAIDQKFIEMILKSTGPVVVPELDSAFNSKNVILEMRNQWGPKEGEQSSKNEWIGLRKQFMQPLAQAIREKIFEDTELVGLSRVIIQAFEQRHLQIYFDDAGVNEIFGELGWNGTMSAELQGDFWSTIETNLGFNKVNAKIGRKYEYQVAIDENGQGEAKLSIEFVNPSIGVQTCEHGASYSTITSYNDLISDCYWNYLRVYLPLGITTHASSQHPIPRDSLIVDNEWDGELRQGVDNGERHVVLENMLLIPSGETIVTSIKYLIPNVIINQTDGSFRYNLHVRKQAGTKGDPINIRINLPEKAVVSDKSKQLSFLENGGLSYRGALETDLFLTIEYEIDN
jgi:hypothetical protein